MCQDAVDSKEEGEEEKKEYRKGEKRTLTPNTGLLLPLSTTSRFFFYISDKLTMNLLLSCFGIYPTCRSVGAFTRIHQFRFSRRLTASIACPTSKQHVDIESSAVCIFIQWQKKKKGSKQRDAGAGVDVGTRSIANKMYRPCYIWLHFLSLLSVWRVHRNFNAPMTVDGYDWRGVSVQHEIRIQWTENSIMNGDLVVAWPDSLPNIDKSLDACESGMKLLKLNRTENASDSIQQNRCRKPLQIVLNFYGRAFQASEIECVTQSAFIIWRTPLSSGTSDDVQFVNKNNEYNFIRVHFIHFEVTPTTLFVTAAAATRHVQSRAHRQKWRRFACDISAEWQNFNWEFMWTCVHEAPFCFHLQTRRPSVFAFDCHVSHVRRSVIHLYNLYHFVCAFSAEHISSM